jgi:hypothetical protein
MKETEVLPQPASQAHYVQWAFSFDCRSPLDDDVESEQGERFDRLANNRGVCIVNPEDSTTVPTLSVEDSSEESFPPRE